MIVSQLIRELSNYDPKSRIYLDRDTIHIGKDFSLHLPTKQDREISRMYEERNGVKPD